jgi:hypothetical protein
MQHHRAFGSRRLAFQLKTGVPSSHIQSSLRDLPNLRSSRGRVARFLRTRWCARIAGTKTAYVLNPLMTIRISTEKTVRLSLTPMQGKPCLQGLHLPVSNGGRPLPRRQPAPPGRRNPTSSGATSRTFGPKSSSVWTALLWTYGSGSCRAFIRTGKTN